MVVYPDTPQGFLQLPTHPAHDSGLAAIGRFLRGHALLDGVAG